MLRFFISNVGYPDISDTLKREISALSAALKRGSWLFWLPKKDATLQRIEPEET